MGKRNHLLDGLIGLVLTGAAFFVIEFALGAMGVEGGAGGSNLSRGFEQGARYLLPDPNVPGGWVTNFYEDEGTERSIPPKGERKRVLMFGGSNTNGFPAPRMKGRLDQVCPEEEFEVVNLGRSGYGSERVRIIFEQAIEELDPDVMMIYSAHNEFVERGFQMDLTERRSGVSAELTEVVADTRLFDVFANQFGEERASPQTQPEAWEWEYQKFAGLTYEETKPYFEAYERNIRTMCESAAKRGIKVYLSTVIYNRVSAPFSSTFPNSMTEDERARFTSLHDQASAHFPEYFQTLLPKLESERPHGHEWGTGRPVVGQLGDGLPGWRKTTGRLSGTERRIADTSTWKPIIRQMDASLVQLHAREFGQSTREQLEQSEALLKEALTLCSDHPSALFELALLEYVLAREPETYVAHFEEAARWDRAPRKATSVNNEIIREIASDVDGVTLIESDEMFRECHPDGLVGWEWMTDHCHLHLGARGVLMAYMAEQIGPSFRTAGNGKE